jgi:F-type H+-transporting ATPase subunit epsilon
MNMPGKLDLSILTPDKVFFQGEVAQLIVATPEGEMGMLAQHEATIAVVPEGILKIQKDDGEWHSAAVSQGFLDMSDSTVEVFVDSAEWSEDIDVLRSEAALQRAEARLRGPLTHTEHLRTNAAVARAHARLQAAKASNK